MKSAILSVFAVVLPLFIFIDDGHFAEAGKYLNILYILLVNAFYIDVLVLLTSYFKLKSPNFHMLTDLS